MKQTIDISPEKVAPIATAALRFFALETTLVPGNLRQQLAVLEVFLSGLSQGELLLATPAPPPVESGTKGDGDKDPEGDIPRRKPTLEELELERRETRRRGTGEGQSG